MGKKSSRGAVSKFSSAAAPSSSAATLAAKKSSVIRSAFSPSEYQLALFASVIQGLDAHHLRIHDVNSGRLQCEHAVNPKELITSLDWGYYGDSNRDRDQHLKKKRKRSSAVNGVAAANEQGNVVVAFGTSSSEIRMYCPAEDKILGTLSGGHERGIRDFKFTVGKPGVEGWSIGGDGKLVQWDLRKGNSIRVLSLPSTSVTALARPVPSNPPVLCASQTPYLIDLEEGSESGSSFSAMRNPVHSLISSSKDSSSLSGPFLAADSDRYINVFDSQKRKLLGSLVSDKEVDTVSFYPGPTKVSVKGDSGTEKQLLAAVTRDGAIELFSNPFHRFSELSSDSTTASLKSLRKSMTRRPDAVIKIVRPDKSRTTVPIVSVSFHGADLVVAWVEGGIDLVFDKIRWQDEETEGLAFQGENELARGKSASTIGSTMMNGTKDIGKTHVDETNATVEAGGIAEGTGIDQLEQDDAMSMSSGDEDEAEADEPKLQKQGRQLQKSRTKGDEDVEMADADADADEGGEPSFGELLRANASEQIDVEAELDGTDKRALVPSSTKTSLQIPSGLSLATVLSQSLKTNDNTLLESCFHTTDMDTVKLTIQRMDSSLATILLQKLAERLSTRPGRYGHLLLWVQWTCVSHGGSIAGKPDILHQMTSLFKVMDQRSSSLPSLLLLKGKLDMLDSQLQLRQSLQVRDNRLNDDDYDEEERVIYVEGQEDLAADSDDEDTTTFSKIRSGREKMNIAERDGDEDMAMIVNGVDSDSDSEDEEDLLDNEAEVSDDGEGSEDDDSEDDSEDDDDEDSGSLAGFVAGTDDESELSVDEAPRAPPPSTKNKLKRSRK